MPINIIGFTGSPFILILVITLKELGIPYEIKEPSSHDEIKTEEYLATKHPL